MERVTFATETTLQGVTLCLTVAVASCRASQVAQVVKNPPANSRKLTAAAAMSLQLCPTLCDPIDGSPPGSAIPGILQSRTLENPRDGRAWWAAIYGVTQSRTQLK